jgi:hypothetical protein
MQLDQAKQAIKTTPKGSNIILEWVRPCKTRKGVTDVLTKSVRMVGRMGIEYNNIGTVQDKREAGDLPAVPQGLPWGVWSEYPYLIEHKGSYYIRLYNGTSSKVHPEVHFFKNGIECAKDDISACLLASELESEKGECFTCKVENVTRIHSEAEWLMVCDIGQEKIEIPVPAKVLATV